MSERIRRTRKQTVVSCYLRRNPKVHQNPLVGWLVPGTPGPAPGLMEPGETHMALRVQVCGIAGAGRKLPIMHRSGHQSQWSRTRSCETQSLVTTSVRCLYNLCKWTRLEVIGGLQLHLALELTLKIIARNNFRSCRSDKTHALHSVQIKGTKIPKLLLLTNSILISVPQLVLSCDLAIWYPGLLTAGRFICLTVYLLTVTRIHRCISGLFKETGLRLFCEIWDCVSCDYAYWYLLGREETFQYDLLPSLAG